MRASSSSAFLVALLLALSAAARANDYDVTAFGAVADGVTDSTTAIQAAIDAAAADGGGRVVVPAAPAPYVVSDTIRIASSGIELDGTGARLFLADGALNGRVGEVLLVSGTEAEPIRGVEVHGLAVDANYFNQVGARGSKAIVFRFVEDSRIDDVVITRPYVGLSMRRSTRLEARRVTVTDYEEDAFDAGGDADLVSGGIVRAISFMDVVARDAPRAARDGNAFEIEDGVDGVLIENALVENVAGNGVGMRNHSTGENVNHSSDVELRNVEFRDVEGLAVFARARPVEERNLNSYRRVRLVNVTAESPVAMWGPLDKVVLTGGRYTEIHIGFQSPDSPLSADDAVAEVTVDDVDAGTIRINGASGTVAMFNVRAGKIEQIGGRP